jgi:type VI secretion system protein ImpH
MASPERKHDSGLRDLLEARGERFNFFTAVRLLHRLNPSALPVGELASPDREVLRFSHDPSMTFHAGDISKVTFNDERTGSVQPRVVSTFLGLYGTVSPLAAYFSEDVLRAEADDENSLRAFYDLFHHRLLSLFYRSWKKYRPHVGFRDDAGDATTRRLLAYVGNDAQNYDPAPAVDPFLKLALGSLLSLRTRPERTLNLALQRALPGLQVRIESFVERFAIIPVPERTRLAVHNTTLGVNLTIGRRVKDRSGRIRVVIGPVTYQHYEDYMPGGRHYAQLSRMLSHLTGDAVETELEVQLAESDAPGVQLGNKQGAVLGLNTQLGKRRQSIRRTRVLLGGDVETARPYAVTTAESQRPGSGPPSSRMPDWKTP